MKFQKGNPGKKRGTINKFTHLRDDFLKAFQDIGGVEELGKWAKEKKNRAVFYQMIAKMLPRTQEIKADADTKFELIIQYPEKKEK
jgi:hypothetical protein